MSKKILIIEDNKECRELYKIRLEHEKWDVLAIDSADKAIKRILEENYRPNLVLLDLMLPGMSGQEFLEKIKNDPETKDIIVIVMTAMILSQKQKEKMLEEASDLICKADVLPNDLVKKIKKLIGD